MHVGTGDHTYDWNEDWAQFPHRHSYDEGWSHHGVAVTEAGEIVTLHHGEMEMVILGSDGSVQRSWDLGLSEAHGITIVKEADAEYLWIADNGRKRTPGTGFEYPEGTEVVTGRVEKKTLDGETVMSLETPDLAVYRGADYMPTWVAVNEERHGGNGDVWVADGYAQNQVHRYDKAGNYVASITGEEGTAGAFSCPHAIFIDTRKADHELYVADRSNGRVQVYDLEGKFKRVFGDYLTSPSGFVTHGELMVIAELQARLTLTGLDDEHVAYLGDNHQVADVPGWPNNLDGEDKPIATKLLEPGKFNSPHGMAADAAGNLYVAEWLIGGRFVRLGRS